MKSFKNNHLVLVATTALAPLMWGATYIIIAEVLPSNRPITNAVLRVIPAGVLLLVWQKKLPASKDWMRLLVLSALNIGVFQALLFVSATRLPGGVAAVLGALQPVVKMLIGRWFDGTKIYPAAWSAAFMAVVGMAAFMLTLGLTLTCFWVSLQSSGSAYEEYSGRSGFVQ